MQNAPLGAFCNTFDLNYWSWKLIFGLFESGRFTQVLLYFYMLNVTATVTSNVCESLPPDNKVFKYYFSSVLLLPIPSTTLNATATVTSNACESLHPDIKMIKYYFGSIVLLTIIPSTTLNATATVTSNACESLHPDNKVFKYYFRFVFILPIQCNKPYSATSKSRGLMSPDT